LRPDRRVHQPFGRTGERLPRQETCSGRAVEDRAGFSAGGGLSDAVRPRSHFQFPSRTGICCGKPRRATPAPIRALARNDAAESVGNAAACGAAIADLLDAWMPVMELAKGNTSQYSVEALLKHGVPPESLAVLICERQGQDGGGGRALAVLGLDKEAGGFFCCRTACCARSASTPSRNTSLRAPSRE
jgi:hypothetical protein